MQKQKLALNQLKVSSFVTGLNAQQSQQNRGGTDEINTIDFVDCSNNCPSYYDVCDTVDCTTNQSNTNCDTAFIVCQEILR